MSYIVHPMLDGDICRPFRGQIHYIRLTVTGLVDTQVPGQVDTVSSCPKVLTCLYNVMITSCIGVCVNKNVYCINLHA